MRTSWSPWPAQTFLAVLLLVALSACATSGLSFTQDKRIEITSPQNHSSQHLPITIRWTVRNFTVTGADRHARADGGYFGVFLDRAPQPPGKPLSYLAKGDEQCHPQQGCPDARWFTDHNIYSTTSMEFVVEALPTFSREERQRFHEITVVLLDGNGNRIGESAFNVEFKAVGNS